MLCIQTTTHRFANPIQPIQISVRVLAQRLLCAVIHAFAIQAHSHHFLRVLVQRLRRALARQVVLYMRLVLSILDFSKRRAKVPRHRLFKNDTVYRPRLRRSQLGRLLPVEWRFGRGAVGAVVPRLLPSDLAELIVEGAEQDGVLAAIARVWGEGEGAGQPDVLLWCCRLTLALW